MINGLPIGMIYIYFFMLVIDVISFFIGALFLMITTRLFKTQNNDYKTALKVLLLPMIISSILAIVFFYITNQFLINTIGIITFIGVLILNIWLVKKNYFVGTGRAFLILLVAFIIGIIPTIIISFIIIILFFLIFGIKIFWGV